MHKFKKKTKKKINKVSLYIVTCFFLIIFTYLDASTEKNNINLLSYTKTNTPIYVESNELLNIINNKTGVVVLVNNRKSANKIISLLYNINKEENIYLYNLKNDELILNLTEANQIDITKENTEFYQKLLNELGSYTEKYILTNEKNIIETEYRKIYTPMVIFIKNGIIQMSHCIKDENIKDEDLIRIYQEGFNKMNTN